MIIISNWRGRLGNNITQIINCLGIALYYKCDISLPNHSIIKKNKITIPDSKNHVRLKDDFFSRKKIIEKYKVDEKIFNKKEIISIIRREKILDIDDMKLGNNDLVIHIRSGDIMSSNPHKGWVQPPLYFYKKILEQKKWDKIIIISEDRKNPVTNKLLDEYPNISFKINSLKEDIHYILNAKNICFGFGSFVPSLLIFNEEVKNIYYPKYCYRYLLDYYRGESNVIDLPNYIKVGEWKANESQKKFMINYAP